MSQTLASPTQLKEAVRTKYAEVVASGGSCCGPSTCCGTDSAINFADDYASLEGYVADADFGLGCGLPTEHAGIERGDTVVDLGSGAGNDAFIARTLTGPEGRVIGVDFTEEMVTKARENAEKLQAPNVEFRLGDIEDLPIDDETVDVVVSNCVLNLVPDKPRAFAEMRRVLRPGGRFCISDIVTRGALPQEVRHVAALYAGCVSGAVEESEYLAMLRGAGFDDVRVVKEKIVAVPDEVLASVVSAEVLAGYRSSGSAVVSITVTGRRR